MGKQQNLSRRQEIRSPKLMERCQATTKGETPENIKESPWEWAILPENHLSTITAFSTLLMDSPSALVIEERLSGTWTKASESW